MNKGDEIALLGFILIFTLFALVALIIAFFGGNDD